MVGASLFTPTYFFNCMTFTCDKVSKKMTRLALLQKFTSHQRLKPLRYVLSWAALLTCSKNCNQGHLTSKVCHQCIFFSVSKSLPPFSPLGPKMNNICNINWPLFYCAYFNRMHAETPMEVTIISKSLCSYIHPASASSWLGCVTLRTLSGPRIIGWGIRFKLQMLCPQEDV